MQSRFSTDNANLIMYLQSYYATRLVHYIAFSMSSSPWESMGQNFGEGTANF